MDKVQSTMDGPQDKLHKGHLMKSLRVLLSVTVHGEGR